MLMNKNKILKDVFGHDSFRPGQEEIVDSILDWKQNRGVVAIMPTGGGKSLLFQLPSLIYEGMTLVISPLISLMKDQVDSLNDMGIGAAYWNSTQTKKQHQEVINSINLGLIDILYIAPERFNDDEFLNILYQEDIGILAIDEAHCISQWGHDFRPDYRKIKSFKDVINPKQIIALTATATPEVQNDICNQLGIPAAKRYIRGFERSNLKIVIENYKNRDKSEISHYVAEDVVEQLRSNNKTGIIYTGTRNNTESLSEFLDEYYDIESQPYHAGLPDKIREEIQEEWSKNGGIIIATCAFGMGIDRHDVRFVFHMTMPGTLEAWYQEIGRAGRDGNPALCKTYFNDKDYQLQQFFINLNYPPRYEIEKLLKWLHSTGKKYGGNIQCTQALMKKLSGCQFVSGAMNVLRKNGIVKRIKNGHYKLLNGNNYYELLQRTDWSYLKLMRNQRYNQLNNIKSYFDSSECRTKGILRHFGDNGNYNDCGNCDCCLNKKRT